MKKTIMILFSVLLFGCSLTNTPTSSVQRYLNNYISLSDDVLMDLETTISSEDLSNNNREIYKNVLLKQYKDMKYEIKDESIKDNKAEVLVKITVYDLFMTEVESSNYLNNHPDEFNDVNLEFDKDLFNTYRINQMLKTNNRVDYEILFKLNKVDGEWIILELDRDDLEKLHGLYNYKNN